MTATALPVEIRAFADSDWPGFWPILRAVAAAGETYALPVDIGEAEARDDWLGGLLGDRSGTPGAAVVAVQGERVLGSAHMGPNRLAQGAHVGTASFMVSRDARGLGVGRALGEYVIDWHRRHGFGSIVFNAVVETNTAAIALWTSLGFEIVGTVQEAFRHPSEGYVGLHVMQLQLDRLASSDSTEDR